MNHQQEDNHLKARFTQWLEKLVCNARIDYLRQSKRSVETISIEDVPANNLPVVKFNMCSPRHTTDFDFEEERLAEAFYQLPLMKQKIPTMLFVDDIKPEEISKKLNCSSQYVYNQRYEALKNLRQLLNEGGEKL